MTNDRPTVSPGLSGIVLAASGIIAGGLAIVGAVALLWGSQDAMRVLIHWIGEERVLGRKNVVVLADGSKLLTNPVAMVKMQSLIWGVGVSELAAGVFLFWKSFSSARSWMVVRRQGRSRAHEP